MPLRSIPLILICSFTVTLSAVQAFPGDELAIAATVFSLPSQTAPSAGVKKTKRKSAASKRNISAAARRPGRQYLTIKEVESRNVYKRIEHSIHRMCIKEVPFFLALHECFYRDPRLDRGDTLVLKKKVLSVLLVIASQRFSTSELTISPVVNIDSMMMYRPKTTQKRRTTRCGMIIYAVPGAYEIPKTGARVSVPRVLRGTVTRSEKSAAVFVSIRSKGVRLQLPTYAKALSLGMIADMDIRYAELISAGPGFEARLMYPVKEKRVKRRGWSLNVTECNKIRPFAR